MDRKVFRKWPVSSISDVDWFLNCVSSTSLITAASVWIWWITTTEAWGKTGIIIILYYYSFCREEDESVSHLFWDRVHVFFSFGRICIFVRVFISDYFSLVFKDVLFGFYSSHKNLKDKYFLINLFIFLAKLFLYLNLFFCLLNLYFLFFVKTWNVIWILFLFQQRQSLKLLHAVLKV